MLVAIGLFVLVLGTIGYEQLREIHYELHGSKIELQQSRYGFLDSLYRASTLFAFGGVVDAPVPTALQIARILAPIFTVLAAVGALFLLGREQARVLGIRMFARGHIIIAGLGASGSALAQSLDDLGKRVVVVESDPANERLASARERGIAVLVGDATDHALLRKAGLGRAHYLVALCGSDGRNVDVASAAVGLSPKERRAALTVFVDVRDISLWRSIAHDFPTLGEDAEHGPRLEYFNLDAIAAQLLLERHRPFATANGDGRAPRPHILLVGLGALGEQLALGLARQWRGQAHWPAEKLRVTLAGTGAEEHLCGLRERYPSLERYCELGARPSAIESAAFQSGRAMLGEQGACDVTRAYVCLDDDGDALTAALALHAPPATLHVPVAVAVSEGEAGVATVLKAESGRFANITPFGLRTEAASHELLQRGSNEIIAKAKHEQYVRDELAVGNSVEQNPSMRPWEQLDDDLREDNRKFADGISKTLRESACYLVPMPLPDPDQPQFAFTDEEVERLARQEHERWMKAKEDDGWRFGVPRDNERKIHDQLKDWEQLDERNKDRDREPIRELPQMLELAGFRIQRHESPAPGL